MKKELLAKIFMIFLIIVAGIVIVLGYLKYNNPHGNTDDPDQFKYIEFTLKGDSLINITQNEKYSDPLFICFDTKNNKDLSDKVTITGKVNNSVIGKYSIKYTLTLNGKKKTLTRMVNVTTKVVETSYSYTLSTKELTNQNVDINFTSNINNFSYIVDPKNEKVYSKSLTYQVGSNGKYTFMVYDTANNYKEYTITISNIDKTAPKISSCTSVIENGQTIFLVTSSDTDIAKYVFNNDMVSTTSKYTANKEIENAQVTVYDKASNTSKATCSYYYKEVMPTGNETIVEESNNSTMKVWMELKTRSARTSYYVTHIWVEDAYKQIKTKVPNNFGKELLPASDLVKEAVSKNNYQNKVIVAVNGSGFVLNGSFGQKYYNINADWEKTGDSPLVITEGKVLRDFSSTIPASPYITYGIRKDGILAYYRYTAGINLQTNIDVSKKIINDGVQNTWTFTPVLVSKGVTASTSTTQNIRNAICQINKNNFVLITDVFNDERTGFSYKELGDYMVSLGCITGVNIDGGGSASLIYKDRNSNPLVIAGNTRNIADILYFHE